MYKQLFRTGILGGVTVFVWEMISWMVLPWHRMTYNSFTSESAVLDCIRDNVTSSGIYTAFSGPTVFASVDLRATSGMCVFCLIISLAIQIIAACLITWLLMQTKPGKYKKKVAFVTIVGVIVAVLAYLPQWNWYHFSACYTLVNFFDMIISWFLAGLVMVKILKRHLA